MCRTRCWGLGRVAGIGAGATAATSAARASFAGRCVRAVHEAGGGSVRFSGISGVEGSPRTDVLIGDDGPNVLRDGAGSDLLVALGGPDVPDVLDDQAGADLLLGGSDDTCISGAPLGCRAAPGSN